MRDSLSYLDNLLSNIVIVFFNFLDITISQCLEVAGNRLLHFDG